MIAVIAMALVTAVICGGVLLRQNRLDRFPLTAEKLSDIQPEQIIETFRGTFDLNGGVLVMPPQGQILPSVRKDGRIGGMGHLQFELHYLRNSFQQFTLILDAKNPRFSHIYRGNTSPLNLQAASEDGRPSMDPICVLTALQRFPLEELGRLYPQSGDAAGYSLEEISGWDAELEGLFSSSRQQDVFLLCSPGGSLAVLESTDQLKGKQVLVIEAYAVDFVPLVQEQETAPQDEAEARVSTDAESVAATQEHLEYPNRFFVIMDLSDLIRDI